MILFQCLFLTLAPFIISTAFAQDLSYFVTPRDLLRHDSVSRINLQNRGNASVTVYGLYVRQYGYITPGDTCDHATLLYPGSLNLTIGSFLSPTIIKSGRVQLLVAIFYIT